MPRWVVILIAVVAVIWAISDPEGFASFIKTLIGSIITLFKELSS